MDEASVFKQLNKRTLAEDIASQIQGLILDGRIKPSEQLPGEYELAEQFGVNRSTVREALSILKTLRVIDIRKGEGTFINETEKSSIESVVFQSLSEDGLDMESFHDVVEAVACIEAAAAKLAAQRVTDSEAQELKAYVEIMPEQDYASWDRDFHLLVGKVAKSSILMRIANTNWIILVTKYSAALFDKPGALSTAISQHREIVDAITGNQPQEAFSLMESHFLWAWHTLSQ